MKVYSKNFFLGQLLQIRKQLLMLCLIDFQKQHKYVKIITYLINKKKNEIYCIKI